MTLARKQQINLNSTQYYHCISRCVRQAFLCGKSQQTGKNYSHRRAWVLSRLKELTEHFAIHVCAYAIMSNHYHLVLHVDVEAAKTWSSEEVATRWYRLFKGAPDIRKLHVDLANAYIAKWRKQLTDISWFMRCLNEYLARRANLEDGCKGRFWEGRYKSQALLDESALLTCMAYVDLNPIRAGMSKSLESSDYTSIQQRLRKESKPKLVHLKKCSPFSEKAYFELILWTSTVIRENKKGSVPIPIKKILNTYFVNEKEWIHSMNHFGLKYSWLVGRACKIKAQCIALRKKWLHGIRASNSYFLNNAA